MTPKKAFLTTVALALLMAVGLTAGLLPGAGRLSIKQLVAAGAGYTGMELDDDNNPLTTPADPIVVLGGDQILVSAVATYTDGSRSDFFVGADVQYSVDPPELGTIEANTDELRARFIANFDPDVEEEDFEGEIIAVASGAGVDGQDLVATLSIEIRPLRVTSISIVTPPGEVAGETTKVFVKTDGSTEVPVVALTNAPAVTGEVTFLADGEEFDSDDISPFAVLLTMDPDLIGETLEISAETQGFTGTLNDTIEVDVAAFPADTDANGVPDDVIGDMAAGDVTYAVVDGANVAVAALPSPDDVEGALVVATADGLIIEFPADFYDNIVGVDEDAIEEVRVIVRTGASVEALLGATPSGLPALAAMVGNAIDIHLLLVVDGELIEVHNFTSPITITIPLDGDVDVSQLFGISTELDSNADPVVVGASFAQMGVSISVVDDALVFEVTEFTTYVPLSVDGAPVVTGVVPTQGSEAGGTSITITGDDFAANSTVTIGDAAATVTEFNLDEFGPDSLVATTGRTDILSDESRDVVVTNPDLALFGVLADGFMYLPTAPVVDSMSPEVGNEGVIVTLTGDFFDSNVIVTFGPYDTVIRSKSTTELEVIVPEDEDDEEEVQVVVTNPSSGRSGSAGSFEYTDIPVPQTIDPNEGSEAGNEVVVITGFGLPDLATAQVTFGNVAATVYYAYTAGNPNVLGVRTPMVTIGGPTAVDVIVFNTEDEVRSAPLAFTFTPEPPVLDSTDLGSGPVAGGNAVDIFGDWFDFDAIVIFGGVSAEVDNAEKTEITVIVPAHAAGVVDVVIANPRSGLSVTGQYEYLPSCPSILSVSPASGEPGTSVEITLSIGGIFDTGATVTFGGIAANSPELNGNVLTVVTPEADPSVTPVDVVVAQGDCIATATAAFTVTGPLGPVIDLVDPASGPTTGGDVVWIMGENFTSDATVTFGGIAANSAELRVPATEPDADRYPAPSTNAVFNGAGTLIIATTPAGAEGAVDVVVTQASGSDTEVDGYTYVIPDLVLTASNLAANEGEVVELALDITLENISTQIIGEMEFGLGTAFSFTVFYDETVLVPIPDNDPFGDGHQIHTSGAAADEAGKSVASNVTGPGRVIVVISGGQQPVNDGSLCTLNFTSAADAPAGESVTDLTQLSAADKDANPLVVGGIDGTVTVIPPLSNLSVISVDGVGGARTGPETGGFEVVIGGDGLPPAGSIEVTIGGQAATVVSVIGAGGVGGELTIIAPALAIITDTDVDLVVTNTATGASVTLAAALTYTPVAPTLTAVDPSQGISGTEVTLTGTDFDLDATVTIGGAAADITSQDVTTIVVTAPNGSGVVDVVVTNATTELSSTLVGSFTYMPPAITSIDPTEGREDRNTAVIITGTWFAQDATVTFGGAAATLVVISGDGLTINCVTPTGAPGAVDVVVTQLSGTATLVAAFTYTAIPAPKGGGDNAGGWGPCFVATAAYGSPMADEVATLREFRDQYLLSNALGAKFVKLYYTYSPRMADAISENAALRTVVRAALVPVVALSKLMLGTSTTAKIAGISLIGLMIALARRRKTAKSEA